MIFGQGHWPDQALRDSTSPGCKRVFFCCYGLLACGTCSGTLERELQVGMIKHFMKHILKVIENSCTQEKVHVFAYIQWYVKHNQADWYGTSVKLCTNITYAISACSLMPIQRIVHRRAYGKLDVVIPPNTMSKKVLVAIPIHMKFIL